MGLRERRAFIKALNRALAISRAPANGQMQEKKVEQPTAHRKANETMRGATPLQAGSPTFEQQFNQTDAIHARGMGVLLD
jgi:hypothetical protein